MIQFSIVLSRNHIHGSTTMLTTFYCHSLRLIMLIRYDCAGCAAPKSAADWPNDLRLHWGTALGARVEAQYPLSRFAGAPASAFVRADADGTVVCASYVQARLARYENNLTVLETLSFEFRRLCFTPGTTLSCYLFNLTTSLEVIYLRFLFFFFLSIFTQFCSIPHPRLT